MKVQGYIYPLNESKTQHIIIGLRPVDNHNFLNDLSDKIKFLGVLKDKNLNWNSQINYSSFK